MVRRDNGSVAQSRVTLGDGGRPACDALRTEHQPLELVAGRIARHTDARHIDRHHVDGRDLSQQLAGPDVVREGDRDHDQPRRQRRHVGRSRMVQALHLRVDWRHHWQVFDHQRADRASARALRRPAHRADGSLNELEPRRRLPQRRRRKVHHKDRRRSESTLRQHGQQTRRGAAGEMRAACSFATTSLLRRLLLAVLQRRHSLVVGVARHHDAEIVLERRPESIC